LQHRWLRGYHVTIAQVLRSYGDGGIAHPLCAGRDQGDAPMAWLLLIIAGLLEVGWAIGLKYTEGFTRVWPSVFTLGAMVLSVVLLGVAMKSLPVGTSYAVWVGVGAVGTAILGMVLFGEPATAGRLASLGLIVAGIVGLKLASA
jgi:quaternary ammonium compound-resistance protein SugE